MSHTSRWLVLVAMVVVIGGTSSVSASLSFVHGRVSFSNPDKNGNTDIDSVAAIDINDNAVSHYIDCITTDNRADLVWERDGSPGNLLTDFAPSEDALRLSLVGFRNEDLGHYYDCRDTVTGESSSLKIEGGEAAICPFSLWESNIVTVSGSNVSLQVSIDGYLPISASEVIWTGPANNTVTESGDRYVLMDDNKTLLVQNVEAHDSGTYNIQFRDAMTTIDLDVHVDPGVVVSPNSLAVMEHNRVTLTCTFTGNPAPTITWEREGTASLPVETRRSITSTSNPNSTVRLYTVTSMLALSTVFYEDRGRYRCAGTNTQVGDIVRTTTSTYAEMTVTPQLNLTGEGTVRIEENGLVLVSDSSIVKVHCTGSGTLSWHSSSGADIPVATTLSPTINVFQRRDVNNNRQTLTIQSFSSENIAVYTCRTDLTISNNSIFTSIFITDADPGVYITEEMQYAAQGSNVTITAIISSSNLNTTSVEWYHEGTLINTTNDNRYSLSIDIVNSRSVLNIMNVDTDILGGYTIIVNGDGRSENDSVQLVFPVPPSSSVSPSYQAVDEGEAVQFQCQATGTEPTVRWSREGDQPLPNGVIQNGDNLVIDSVSRSHAGDYVCIVTNIAGNTNSSVAELTVFYAPTATITLNETGEISINQSLSVIAEHGGLAPTFFCASDGFPLPTLTWSVMGGGDFPSGVVESMLLPHQVLRWTRPLEYTDTGRYECIAWNSNGTSRTVLDLLVQRQVTIGSIYPESYIALSRSSPFSFLVPEGYSEIILTCTAYGWPRPTIEWLRNGQQALDESRMVSDSTSSNQDSAFVSARLRWTVGFGESDIGDYTCIVRANDTNAIESKSVSLEQTLPTTPSLNPVQCSVSSAVTYFQIRVLETECLSWDDAQRNNTARDFLSTIISVLEVECSDCEVTDVKITELPTCSNLVDRAAFFRGSISTTQRGTTEDLFCALNRWQESNAFVQIENTLYLVDSKCSFMSESSNAAECPNPSFTMQMIFIIVGSVIGAFLLAVVVMMLVLGCMRYRKATRGKVVMTKNGTTTRSNYDTTYPRARGNLRGTISPSSGLGQEGNYSSLDKSFHRQNTQELESLSHSSKACLISPTTTDSLRVDEKIPEEKFVILQNCPEPYMIAMSSSDHLNQLEDEILMPNMNSPPVGSLQEEQVHSNAEAVSTDGVIGALNPILYEKVDVECNGKASSAVPAPLTDHITRVNSSLERYTTSECVFSATESVHPYNFDKFPNTLSISPSDSSMIDNRAYDDVNNSHGAIMIPPVYREIETLPWGKPSTNNFSQDISSTERRTRTNIEPYSEVKNSEVENRIALEGLEGMKINSRPIQRFSISHEAAPYSEVVKTPTLV